MSEPQSVCSTIDSYVKGRIPLWTS